jgi:ribosomal protein S27AE
MSNIERDNMVEHRNCPECRRNNNGADSYYTVDAESEVRGVPTPCPRCGWTMASAGGREPDYPDS